MTKKKDEIEVEGKLFSVGVWVKDFKKVFEAQKESITNTIEHFKDLIKKESSKGTSRQTPKEPMSLNVAYLDSLGIRATKGSAEWIDIDKAMEAALKIFQEKFYKPSLERIRLESVLDADLPENVVKEDVVFDYVVPEERFQVVSADEDLAFRYLIAKKESAHAGIIVYARYKSEWVVNPMYVRPLIVELLKRMGRG